ncbi:MAG: NUDIX hydrolase [Pseudomonadota bacterium]
MADSGPASPAEHPSVRSPRDAASLIVYERVGATTFVLMGQRRATQAFMPNRVVFPGGRVDPADIDHGASAGGLAPPAVDLLLDRMAGTPSAARAHALGWAAARETYEETGRLIGRPALSTEPAEDGTSPPQPDWARAAPATCLVDIATLAFVGRALTPPGEVRRYDTRFFAVPRSAIAAEVPDSDGELGTVAWHDVAALDTLNTARITQIIAQDFAAALNEDGAIHAAREVPYYHVANGVFRRDLLGACGQRNEADQT